MAGIDKAAIAFSIAIVAIGVGFAFYGDSVQNNPPVVSAPVVSTPAEEPMMKEEPMAEIVEEEETPVKAMMAGWDRLTSTTDPGVGHESHQLAIILAPSENVYSGELIYDASEKIQLVTLHGPLADGEDNGQAIWTPDGETKFALTFVDPKKSKGEWKFAGNALAVHTMNTTPFIVDYKLDDLEEKSMSETVMTGTVTSVQDPGIGHESHQLSVLLAPSSDVYSGILSYSASEPIQLVSLRGPVGSGEQPEKTWTPDGETIFELTFVDPKKAMGSWEFSGNALAVHTMNPTEFTTSFSVSAVTTPGEVMEMEEHEEEHEEETMEMEETSEPKTVSVSVPAGTSVPGCEETDECYIPASVTINAGDTVEWPNVDTAAHTVTSGSPSGGPSGEFDSSLLMGGATYSFTFEEAGSYDYFCMVHPWMVGSVQVN